MKIFNAKLLKYELKNQIKNGYVPFFGIFFPIILSQLIIRTALIGVPSQFLPQAHIQIFYSFALFIPLCCVFLSHCNSYGYDVEKEIPLRLRLFGISKFTQLSCRLQAELIIATIGICIFSLTFFLSFKVPNASANVVILSILMFYLLCISLFLLAHGMALIIRSYEGTSGIGMGIYFFFLFIGGGLGLQQEQFPEFLKKIASLFPFYHFSKLMGEMYYKKVNLVPLYESLAFFTVISIILVIIGIRQKDIKR